MTTPNTGTAGNGRGATHPLGSAAGAHPKGSTMAEDTTHSIPAANSGKRCSGTCGPWRNWLVTAGTLATLVHACCAQVARYTGHLIIGGYGDQPGHLGARLLEPAEAATYQALFRFDQGADQ